MINSISQWWYSLWSPPPSSDIDEALNKFASLYFNSVPEMICIADITDDDGTKSIRVSLSGDVDKVKENWNLPNRIDGFSISYEKSGQIVAQNEINTCCNIRCCCADVPVEITENITPISIEKDPFPGKDRSSSKQRTEQIVKRTLRKIAFNLANLTK